MTSLRRSLIVLVLMTSLLMAPVAAAEPEDSRCKVANAEGPAVARAATGGGAGKGKGKKKRKVQPQKVTLQADTQSANKVVNLGDDREAEEVTFRINVSPRVSEGFEKRLEVVAEPFANSSETGETVTFPEPTFSRPELSGNGKRITFTMCVDAPNDLPAGKYTSTVMLEGPPPIEEAVMTATLNAKDGHGFFLAAFLTAVLSFLILLYKGASDRRPLLLKEAEKEKPGPDRDKAIRDAESWRGPGKSCIRDLGWLVPTLASIAAAFALLYAAYDTNPAWGEGGIVTNAIALIGTGLAAVGAKTVFTQASSPRSQ